MSEIEIVGGGFDSLPPNDSGSSWNFDKDLYLSYLDRDQVIEAVVANKRAKKG